MISLKHKLIHPVFRHVTKVTKIYKVKSYVIGGYVRDLILNRPSKDIDIVVIGNGMQIAQEVAKLIDPKLKVTVYKNFGTAMFNYKDTEIEFVGARKESYQRNSRKPIVEDGTLEDDQNRRDFTINALALDLSENYFGELIDPFNGMLDLQNKIIKTPLDPTITFSDDPLRMLRAIRFSTQLDFKLSEQVFEAIKLNKNRIEIISRERINDELNKIILTKKPSIGLLKLDETGLLELIFPQLTRLKGVEVKKGRAHKDNFYHTIQVLDNLSTKTDNLWLRWAALLHDIAKPDTKKFQHGTWTFHGHEFFGAKMIPEIFKKLKLPLNEKMKYIQKLVLLHLRPIALTKEEITDSAIRRLLFEAGDDIDDLMLLSEADITSKNEERVQTYLNNFQLVRKKLKEVEEKDHIKNWQPPINGDIIMKTFDILPSKLVGEIKDAIKDAILDGKIENSYEAAYLLMIELGEKHGLLKRK